MGAHHKIMMLPAIAMAFVVSTAITGTTPAAADKYYDCGGPGATKGGRPIQFQVKNNAARCYIAPGYLYMDVGNCLPGQTYRTDYTGNADKCVTGIGTAAVIADPPCASGYSLERRSAKDRCRRPQAEEIRAPYREVNK